MKGTSMANKLVDRSFPVDPEIAKARRDNLANSTRLFKKKQRGRQSSMLRRVLADAGYKSI